MDSWKAKFPNKPNRRAKPVMEWVPGSDGRLTLSPMESAFRMAVEFSPEEYKLMAHLMPRQFARLSKEAEGRPKYKDKREYKLARSLAEKFPAIPPGVEGPAVPLNIALNKNEVLTLRDHMRGMTAGLNAKTIPGLMERIDKGAGSQRELHEEALKKATGMRDGLLASIQKKLEEELDRKRK